MVQMSIRLPARSNRRPRPGLSGPARVDRRTKDLTKRLRPGDIAVIDHEDLDRVSAEALVACKPAAVVNASTSISGRYPNLGPEILVAAGIPLLDHAGPGVMELKDGTELNLEDGAVRTEETTVATATVLDNDAVQEAMTLARAGLSDQLEAFAQNTMDYLRKERELLFDGVGVPDIRTDLDGRHALIVVRGYHYKDDLQTLRHYIREYKPILIGVDGGADALIEARHKPDLIVGDMDSVSDDALRCGAEILVQAYREGGHAPGEARLQRLGVPFHTVAAPGISEDIALLLAHDKGAELIVAVGTHFNLLEFLERNREGMSSTFFTRLKVGDKLIDARGVSSLFRGRAGLGPMFLFVLGGLGALAAAVAVSSDLQRFIELLAQRVQSILGL